MVILMEKIEILNSYIQESDKIVFFGGAGVSTASGIKDFRGQDGLYHEKYKFPPEEILSHHFFIEHTKDFYEFYLEKLNCLEALPNVCHKYLRKLELEGKIRAIVTQNIDGLHQKAGSLNVLQLHGTIMDNYCLTCGKWYDAKYVFQSKGIPKCHCGGFIKPDVILYEEALDEEIINKSIQAILDADLLIVAGTSLMVYPANTFIRYFKGKHLVMINLEKTSSDDLADLVIYDDIKKVFSKLFKMT